MLKHIRWNDVELEKLNPLLDRQMITGENLMLARVLLKKGCVVPEHSHLNE
jgi:quercetin dioxygenase-like cupin family protein